MTDTAVSLTELNRVADLTARGRSAEVLQHLRHGGTQRIRGSPTLALHLGISLGRLGRHGESLPWVEAALEGAGRRGDLSLEARALNVLGALALERGDVGEAEVYFRRGLAAAEALGDHGNVGRCCNNLGIIANLRGDHAEAVGSYTLALPAFQRAGSSQGMAETENNLRITYRDQEDLVRALEAADRAVQLAESTDNLSLTAYAVAGRAEIRLLSDEVALAHLEVQWAMKMHRDLGDVVGEAEAWRVVALILRSMGKLPAAEERLRSAIGRAAEHRRPLLEAECWKSLASIQADRGDLAAAQDAARTARAGFSALGAAFELRQVDDFLSRLTRSGT